MYAIPHRFAAALVCAFLFPAATPARGENSFIIIANQGPRDLHVTLATGSSFGQGVTLIIAESAERNRRGSVTRLTEGRHHGTVGSGETAILAARDSGPCVRLLRVTEPGRKTSATIEYSVRMEEGDAIGFVDLMAADPPGIFEEADSDMLIFHGS